MHLQEREVAILDLLKDGRGLTVEEIFEELPLLPSGERHFGGEATLETSLEAMERDDLLETYAHSGERRFRLTTGGRKRQAMLSET